MLVFPATNEDFVHWRGLLCSWGQGYVGVITAGNTEVEGVAIDGLECVSQAVVTIEMAFTWNEQGGGGCNGYLTPSVAVAVSNF